ncbi:hypothetical protein [Burkholderia gladioli]|uniref:hypothetical protein n=1 Tax=Burkholderia gladioli TaxID=28095 RepID=UPI00163FDFCD|nr:hypothetical protein [Burkholderia gladioli]
MLKFLFIGAFKSPGKFLALCVALYLAAHSIIVAAFVVIAAVGYFKSNAKKEPQAPNRESVDGHDAANARQQTKRGQAETAGPDVQVAPAPQRQYAKSAAVIPINARASSARTQSMKMGTK